MKPLAAVVAVALLGAAPVQVHRPGAQPGRLDMRMRRTEINGAPGALVTDANGGLLYAIVLDVAPGGVIETVRTVRNPAKLAHLGPVGDLRAVMHSHGAGREG